MERIEVLFLSGAAVLMAIWAFLEVVIRKSKVCRYENMVKGKDYNILLLSDDMSKWMVIKSEDNEFPFMVELTLKQLMLLKVGDIVQWDGEKLVARNPNRPLSDDDIAQMDAFMR